VNSAVNLHSVQIRKMKKSYLWQEKVPVCRAVPACTVTKKALLILDYDLRKYSFTIRVVDIWNNLPESVISADSVDSFKIRLDRFWSNQDILFDNKYDLTGIGNSSRELHGDGDSGKSVVTVVMGTKVGVIPQEWG